MGFFAGIDVGGSHIEGVLVDRKLSMKAKVSVKSKKRDRKSFIEDFKKVLDGLSEGYGVSAAGVGVPGAVKGTKMFWSPNCGHLEGIDFGTLLGKVSKNVAVDNDVNCMALYEMAMRKEKNMLVLTLGTGVGGGIVIDGRLHNGRPFAGEIGHMTVDPDGVQCTCGSRGCFQMYASASGVRRISAAVFGREMSPKDVSSTASKGNRKALKVWEEYGKVLGMGLSSLCWVLDPQVIVVSGGISEAMPYFRKSMEMEMKKRLVFSPPHVVCGKRDANALGAALMAMKL
jgi:glucokinase